MVKCNLNKWIVNKLYSLSGYVVLSIVLIHILLLPILYYLLIESYRTSSYEQFISHNTEIAGMISDVVSTIDRNENSDLESILDSASLGGNVLYLQLIDSTGKSYLSDNSKYITYEYKADNDVDQHGDHVYFMSFPVYLKNTSDYIATLKIGFDESLIIEDYQKVKSIVATILIIYFIIVLILSMGLVRLIHKPLHLLRKQSKEIVDGKVDLPLTNKSRIKEIKFLTQDLEKMRGTLVGLVESMQYKATHDELTRLPNRYLFSDRLEVSISTSERENKKFAILFLDLDRFKEINDTLGHGIGDKVLKIVSRRMSNSLRESDTIARIGGDEFAFILANVTPQVAERIASKIIDLILPAFDIDDHSLKIGASIGVSMYPDNGTDPEVLMRRADVAMYYAKHNNLAISSYHADMDSDHYEKLMLANDLKESINTGYFEPLVQPKINLLTGMTCGCEMLLRWNHPNLGLIYPEKFIPLAERENLIGELTRWAMSNHLHDFIDIINEYSNFHVAINVSPVDLLDSTLFEAINEIIEKSGFPESNLYIEVTENAIMKNPQRSAEILNKFDNRGYKVSIDDFGTGYSSLSYLQQFPISELKIDKSFINDLSKDSNNYPIVTATITMAHDLGISVVAEGVENAEVIELLKEMGCDRVQGYYFCKPINISGFKNWLKESQNSQ